uniref:Uncharacterized protein n=1 Tax=Anas zonorhyncha TaxID=75864 RepID=A0A8B9UUP7_9AVES
MGGGAWPFLVGGAICLVNSVNERDLSLLTSYAEPSLRSNNRSVMPLDVLGRTRATLMYPTRTPVLPPAPRSGRPAFRSQGSGYTLIDTTLGNGYLGSRIDEERSKMRYLV